RDGVGARIKLVAGDLVLYDQKKGGMSYQSAQDPRLHFGLGDRQVVDSVQITWPSGSATALRNLKADQVITIKEGQGLAERSFPRVASRG
ncbi:MAG: ASPIC/UnbV domain-containing protein, partial [Candidatus Acidiferrales bacterium]